MRIILVDNYQCTCLFVIDVFRVSGAYQGTRSAWVAMVDANVGLMSIF